ncbi:DUF4328 domain-containing protein [Streptomyces murinus]|uniref:DUF4328 domain-containing protein n=1 Tax=Streptomyces murinus TaxID=33900 RepID=UPI00363B7520
MLSAPSGRSCGTLPGQARHRDRARFHARSRSPWTAARCARFAVLAAVAVELTRAVHVGPRAPHALPAGSWLTTLYLWATVLTTAVFLVWFAHCRRTAGLLSPGVVRGSAAWGVLARLIPVVCLWAPRPLVQDVLRASTPRAGDAAPARSDRLVDVWWGAWVAHALFAVVCDGYGAPGSPALTVAADVLYGAAAALAVALAVAVIQRITARQAAGIAAGTVAPAGVVAPAPAGPPQLS